MRPHHVFAVLGLILRPFAVLLCVPALVDLAAGRHDAVYAFLGTALGALLVGTVLSRDRKATEDVSRVEAMAVVAGAWMTAAFLGAVPYLQQGFTPIDALFESMSGFTTTGSTIFTGREFTPGVLSPGLIFWRAMTQWLGGMGIIVLFVAVLPALAVAGRRMFFAEAPGPEEEALTPRIRHTAAALWLLYITLTVLEITLLATVGGMSVYDAACHGFTTLAAGGFSPNGLSLAAYSGAAQWIVMSFMFLAGANFALQFRALTRPKVLVRDTEFRVYAIAILVSGLVLAVHIAGEAGHGFEASLRHGLFQSASIMTTTGYASEDFNLWSQGALMTLGVLFFVGGCAGSAGGGPKVVRLIVLFKYLAREVLQALHPRAVKLVRLGGRPVPEETLRQIVGFFVAYVAIFSVVAAMTGMIEGDLRIGLMGSIATIGNIGPGYGAIGPMETFAGLTTATKLLFIFNMWVGRLEVMTVLVLLHPDVLRTLFRRKRLSDARANT